LTVHQVAFERLNDGVHFPLWPLLVMGEVFDAVPLGWAVVLATVALIEKLTMLLTDVFAVPPAIFDLHWFPPLLSELILLLINFSSKNHATLSHHISQDPLSAWRLKLEQGAIKNRVKTMGTSAAHIDKKITIAITEIESLPVAGW
jgi:hypothetical protein